MSIVISDTLPIRALAHLGLLELLRDLFGDVLIPPSVQQELLTPPSGLSVVDTSQFPFVQIQAPRNVSQVQQFLQQLHQGESEALALVMELPGALLLIDEAQGRAVAQQLGLPLTGTLGVLLRAKGRRLISAVRPLLERLQNELNFFISSQLRADVLRLAGE